MKDFNGNTLATPYQVELLERIGFMPEMAGRDSWAVVTAIEATGLIRENITAIQETAA